MARVTVEDCLENVDNRFQLVLIATRRARQLANGAEPFIEWENDKPTIVALREIAAGKINASILDEPVRSGTDEEELLLIELTGAEANEKTSEETPKAAADASSPEEVAPAASDADESGAAEADPDKATS